MAKEPDVILDAARIEIDGVDILVVQIPFAAKDPVAITKQLAAARYPFVLVSREPDRTFRVLGTGSFAEWLRSRNVAGLPWMKVPMHPPEAP